MLKAYALLMLFLCTPHAQVLKETDHTNILAPSVLIRAKEYRLREDGTVQKGMAGCSGTFVSSNTVLTAAHCFENPTTEVWVRDYAGKSMKAELKKVDFAHDLALLKVTKQPPHKFVLLGKGVKLAEHVTNVGSPPPFEFLLSDGMIALPLYRFKGEDDDKVGIKSTYIVTTAMINPGSSGGGAFNDKGELIGVNTMSYGMFGWAGISIAVDVATVREFLKEHRDPVIHIYIQ